SRQASICSWSRQTSDRNCRRQTSDCKRPNSGESGYEGHASHTRITAPLRAGVTSLQVLFASGIAVFGLVGIASLIAVAGRQASDANSWSEGQSAARYALSDFIVRGYNNSANWTVFDDQANSFVPYKTMVFNALKPNPINPV